MVEMKVLDSREDWLQHRKNYIGGSDASAIVGMNPYKSNIDLFLEKTGQVVPEDISDKPYVKYGTQAEMHLRGLFRLDFPEYQVEYIDNNTWLNDKYPFAAASLDGWLTDSKGRKGILEIKTTEILNSMHKEKWKGNHIPQNYYCQCLFYMAVLEADFCILKGQLKSSFDNNVYLQTKHYFIERAEVENDIQYLMKEAEKFWQYVVSGKQPPLQLPAL